MLCFHLISALCLENGVLLSVQTYLHTLIRLNRPLDWKSKGENPRNLSNKLCIDEELHVLTRFRQESKVSTRLRSHFNFLAFPGFPSISFFKSIDIISFQIQVLHWSSLMKGWIANSSCEQYNKQFRCIKTLLIRPPMDQQKLVAIIRRPYLRGNHYRFISDQ